MTYELKTKISDDSVENFLNTISDEAKRTEAFQLLEIFQQISWKPAKMWWSTIVGFGTYTYKYASGQTWDWMRTGFAPRAAGFSLYIMPGYNFGNMQDLIAKLWKHKAWRSCLNIKKLSDIDLGVLEQIIQLGLDDVKERYPI